VEAEKWRWRSEGGERKTFTFNFPGTVVLPVLVKRPPDPEGTALAKENTFERETVLFACAQ
jgi:hypothetical protein